MTAFDVDLDELRQTLGELASCQRDLISVADELDAAHERLQADWSGTASTAEATSYESWRGACADMVTALAALRGIVTTADEHYSRAVSANVALWRQVAP
ncbi:WXG100 family type VII secretion target [Nocardioides sp.]|uniref:WXG100 family type VII secretion target n=1 Tax=Nocardioides sp. TaxID=35761 RepID=UPI0026343B49|nr:WXG100 family type VII secretion target [Nocardioides sp.]MCW2738639.1 family type secretion target [Nocardioides sp.]